MRDAAIRCEGIRKHYGQGETKIEALKGIDLEIYSGELTLLVGPSGSGKSTLLSIITTLLTPDAGKLFLLGTEVNRLSEVERAKFCRENLGIVFQSLFLIPTLSLVENVSVPLLVAGKPLKEAEDRAMEMLDKVHLSARAQLSPSQLSKGQQQKVAIARAMINDSKIIVFDEPTSALDQVSGQEVMTYLQDLAKDQTRSILVVTHDHRIFSFANRMIEINDGELKEASNE